MIFLPVVERELRVAARKRSTFRVRVGAAGVALLIGGGFLLLTTLGFFGFNTSSLGKGMFGTLTWLSLGASVSAGLFFTSDCLSEEKREGTIGFLFLTDLRGHDVVLGKLLATSVRGVYALIAAFPVLAVTLLMGGVTGEEFWKTTLALVNAMLASLVAGLLVSAISRDATRALASTLLVLLAWVGGGPCIDGVWAASRGQGFDPLWSLSSPGYLFVVAGEPGAPVFWPALGVNQALIWLFLGLTCALLPRTWQERSSKPAPGSGRRTRWWKYGDHTRRERLRQTLVDVNPVMWLSCRERWQAALLWAVTLLALTGFAALCARAGTMGWWAMWNYLTGMILLVIYLGAASLAGRFFVEAKRSGLIELLLATPLTTRQIIHGQWRAMLRMFGWPLGAFLMLHLAGTFMVQRETWASFANATATTPTVTVTAGPPSSTNLVLSSTSTVTVVTQGPATTSTAAAPLTPPFAPPSLMTTWFMTASGALVVIGNLVALVWVAMWLGLTTRNLNLVALKTILFVQIIPWFVISFASALIVPLLLIPGMMRGAGTGATQFMVWFPILMTAVATVLYLIKNILFFLWARRRLRDGFREHAISGATGSRTVSPPPLGIPLKNHGHPR